MTTNPQADVKYDPETKLLDGMRRMFEADKKRRENPEFLRVNEPIAQFRNACGKAAALANDAAEYVPLIPRSRPYTRKELGIKRPRPLPPVELKKSLDAAIDELRETAPPVLNLFREKRQDATIVFRFLRDVQIPHREADPWAHLGVNAALDNLMLYVGTNPEDIITNGNPSRTLDAKADRIVKFLRKSLVSKTVKEIAKAAKCDPKTARNRLKTLVDKRLVVKLGDRRYTATKWK